MRVITCVSKLCLATQVRETLLRGPSHRRESFSHRSEMTTKRNFTDVGGKVVKKMLVCIGRIERFRDYSGCDSHLRWLKLERTDA
jgi:hypothetical protein